MRRRLGIKRYCAGMRETCSKYTEESAEAAPGASAPSRTHHPPRSQKRHREPSLPAGGPPAGLPGHKGPLPGLSHRLGAGCRRGAAPGSPHGRHRGHRCRAAGSQRPRPTGPRARRRGRPQPPGPPSPALRSPTTASPSDLPAGRGGKEKGAAAKRAGRRLTSDAFPPAAGDHPAAIAGAAAASGSGAFVAPPPAAECCWGGSPGCSCFAFLRLLPLAVICISPALIDMRLSAAASPRRSLQRAAPPSPPLPPAPLARRCGAVATALPAAAFSPFLAARRLPQPPPRPALPLARPWPGVRGRP